MTVLSPSAVSAVLSRLGLAEDNPGAFDGTWIDTHGPRVESLNPATGEALASVRTCSPEDYERVRGRERRGLRRVARLAGAAARRAGARARRPPARAQGAARRAGHARGRQDPQRGPGRGAGDDRHVRLRGRPVAPALRADHRLGARAPPHARAVAPARAWSASSPPSTSPSRCGPGTPTLARGLRRRVHLEALAPDARCAASPCSEHRRPGACSGPTRPASSACSSTAPARATRLVADRRVPLISFTGSVARRPQGRGHGGLAAGPFTARAGRQQRGSSCWTTPTSRSRPAPSPSARWAPPASAAPARAVCSRTAPWQGASPSA